MQVCITLVHAEEIAGEERGLVAAGAGAQFEDRAALVGHVARKQGDADIVLEFLNSRSRLVALGLGKLAHLVIDGRIREHGCYALGLRLRAAPVADQVDEARELRQFLRQLREFSPRGARCKAGRDFLVAALDEIKLVVGQHGRTL